MPTTTRVLAVMFSSLLSLTACKRDDDAKGPQETSASKAGSEGGQADERAPSDATQWADALDAAVARGIVPSQTDDGTYRVDPFVAALLFEYLQHTGGAPVFTAIEPGDDPAGPSGGFRVGAIDEDSVFARLGLREGDVVESINDVVLSDPKRVGFALDGAENRVRLTVFREDYSMTMSYRLVQGVAWREILAGFTGVDDPSAGDVVDDPDALAAAGGVADEPAPAGGVDDGSPSRGAGGGTPAGTQPAKPTKRPSSNTPSRPRPSTPSKPRPTTPSTPTQPGSSAGPVQCQSATRCTVAKSHFDELVAAPERLQSQATVVPAIRNDVFSGYKLKSIKPGSTVAKLGFRPGDKLTHVNGYDLTDDAQAMQLYFSLGGSRIFKVRYERGGAARVKTIVVV